MNEVWYLNNMCTNYLHNFVYLLFTFSLAEGLEDLCIKALNKLVKKNDIDELPLPECVKNSIKEKRTST